MHHGPRTFGRPTLHWVARSILAGFAASASAQELQPPPPKQRGGYFVPSMAAGEIADSNLLFTQFPESDFVTRFTGGLQTGYRSRPFSFDLQGSRSADYFDGH